MAKKFIERLEEETPLSWNKFQKWYVRNYRMNYKDSVAYEDYHINNHFRDRWFCEQFGVLIAFLEENKINWMIEYETLNKPDWKQAIFNSFKELEQ